MPVIDTIKLRRDTVATWASVNPTLANGEVGYETDTGWMKFGDGSTAWNSLPYFSGQDMFLQISKGIVANHSVVNKFGANKDVDATGPGSVPEDIWTAGDEWVAPTTARTHDIASDSTSDDAAGPAGSGARTVTIYGLDASWNEQSEVITMDGTTNVPTANTYNRIYRMMVTTAGSSESNVGTITATAQTDATVTAEIDAGDGQTLMAIYTVPASKTLYLTSVYASIEASTVAGRADMALVARPAADTSTRAWNVRHYFGLDSTAGHYLHRFQPYPSFAEKTDIVLKCNGVSASNLMIAGGFDGILVD